jgi:mannose-1-phosphate guanylyltransferase
MEQGGIIPIILSGGSGTRLWPLSRAARPKQMLDLAGGGRTMLQATLDRVTDSALFAAPIIVASEAHCGEVERQLEGADARLVLEPAGRNTAPAIALAALAAAPDDLLLVLPSDHLVRDAAAFRDAVRAGAGAAREGWIVTFGMKAERPETGYGYIERGEQIAPGVHRAARFVEKPDAATAETFCASGRHDWNAGLFLFRAGAMLDALRAHAPDVLEAAAQAMGARLEEGPLVRPEARSFAEAPSISIDHAVMEKAGRVAVVPASLGWSDLGSFEAMWEAARRDGDGNALQGDVLAPGARNCLVRSDGPLVAAVGVEDLVVVATADAVLIVPRRDSQRVREAVEALKATGCDELL